LCLPTQGENFGHVIFEALCAGKPVIISDQTPWLHLQEARAGFDLPLERPDLFEQAIEQAAAWNNEEYQEWSNNASNFASMHLNVQETVNQYKKLFS
jgi:glycosyltransferase involved in cell wall biosynthesis